jgi:hypothetical protein
MLARSYLCVSATLTAALSVIMIATMVVQYLFQYITTVSA